MTTKMFETGDRVMTPFGGGTIVFKRMAGPDYNTVETYSVKLFSKAELSPTYVGTLFFVKDVWHDLDF